MDLKDKVAIITGASSGIGRAVAVTLIARGWEVWGTSRDRVRLEGIQGAVLRVKLKHLESWTEGRRAAAARYDELLAGSPASLRLTVLDHRSGQPVGGVPLEEGLMREYRLDPAYAAVVLERMESEGCEINQVS